MTNYLGFIVTSLGFGIALAMDAFSVSLANGLHEPTMKKRRMCAVAGMFSFFQCIMPLLGWVCVHTILECFNEFEKFIPYIALVLLGFIGGKMLYEGITNKDEEEEAPPVGLWGLIVQGVATSIDALSVGLDIGSYGIADALICCCIIAVVTFFICMGGLILGKKVGTKLSGKAAILGGAILLFIGIEIFVSGVFLK